MRNVKAVTGLVLILVSVISFVFWESGGRSLVCDTELLAAAGEISQGQIITAEDLTVKRFGRDCLMDGALAADAAEELVGRQARQYIPAGSQISAEFLMDDSDFAIKENQSIYCIDQESIDMVSSSLRRGDMVRIYGGSGKEDLGAYRVAFVKDSADREVKNASVLTSDEPLKREDSNYTISSIEIICSREEYEAICDYTAVSEKGLTIVQEVA